MKLSKLSNLSVACLSLSVFTNLSAQDVQEDPGGYLFFGTEASAEAGKSHFPIVGVDNKHIYVDGGTGVKKVSQRASVRTRPELKLAEQYVNVLDFKFSASSMENTKRAAQLVADMQFQEMQSEVEVALLRSQMDNGGDVFGGDLSAADQGIASQIEEVQQETSDFQSSMQDALDTGAFEIYDFVDTVFVRGTLDPLTDIPGAYCVVVVNYDVVDISSLEIEGRNRVARVRYLGDVTAGELLGIQLRVLVNEFPEDSATYEFHLFSQDGEQVALSNSNRLKPLTPEQVATFRELEAKTSLLDKG